MSSSLMDRLTDELSPKWPVATDKKLLLAAVNEFRALHPEYSTPSGAAMRCLKSSFEFCEFCEGKGIAADLYSFDVGSERNPDPVIYTASGHEWHCIAVVGDCFVDWSVRQYSENTDFPHIMATPKSIAEQGPDLSELGAWFKSQLRVNRSIAEMWRECPFPEWLLLVCSRMAGRKRWPSNEEIIRAAACVVRTALQPVGSDWIDDLHHATLQLVLQWTQGAASVEDIQASLQPTGFYWQGTPYAVLALANAVWHGYGRAAHQALNDIPFSPFSRAKAADLVRTLLTPPFSKSYRKPKCNH